MINKTILVGRLTAEPELRKTNNGTSYCLFNLAVNRRNKEGNNEADFINCLAWQKTAENLCSYMHKGSQIALEGRLQTRNFDDPNIPNKKVYVMEVVAELIEFIGGKTTQEAPEFPVMNITSDDLPF